MTLGTNFNVNPYNDDFDDTKKYYRLLFKPGQAVQARELTQIQSVLQDQVGKFGNHVFKNGSLVSGGEFFVHKAKFIKIEDTYQSVLVDVNNFSGQTIFSNVVGSDGRYTKRAEVLKVYDANPSNGDPKTLLVAPTYGDDFTDTEIIRTSLGSFAVTASSDSVGNCLLFSVAEGVFYYDGFFIRNDPQTIAISKYSFNDFAATGRIGFEIVESIATSLDDSTLLDPAQDASNYQAPGSDRYKIELVLARRSLSSTDDTKFIELMRVENGVVISQNKFPIYSVLEETFARRTYDESGNYTVRPFRITLTTNESDTSRANIAISPGKAYVFGYEFETISPTLLSVDKPRTTANVINEYETAEYGYFLYTNNHRGNFPLNTLETINLHCVPVSSINTTSAATISNTKIGTARVKSIEYFDATNSADANTYSYKTFLFDIDTNSSITGYVNTATSNTVTIGNTGGGQLFSSVNNAYVGAYLRIISGPGSNELPKLIEGFSNSTQTITISNSQLFQTTPTNTSIFSIDFEIGDIQSLASHSGTTLVSSADIDRRSLDLNTDYEYAFIQQRNREPLIFKIGQDYVKQDSITDLSYTYKRLYLNQQFTSSATTLSSLTGEELASSDTSDYYISVTNAGTSPYFSGQIIPHGNITIVDRNSGLITVNNANNMTANIFTVVRASSSTLTTPKTKTLISGSTTNVPTLGTGTDVFGNGAAVIYSTAGVTFIDSSFISKIPNFQQSLFVPEVLEIVRIVDIGNQVMSSSNVSNGTDITSRYTLDNGQRDSFYDHSSIRLKSKSQAPTGNVVVFYKRFLSSNVGSFFSVDSYNSTDIEYQDIPSFASTNGTTYELRDCLDFRPVRRDGSLSFDVQSASTQPGPGIPQVSSGIDLEYEYYLPRIDKVVLLKDRTFKVIQGIPSLNPVEPKDVETGMTLFILKYPPYVGDARDVVIRHIDHKRFTMRDIGAIEKRVENLEYYTSLSLLEQQTLNQQDYSILDSQNLPRYKNGILVDNFSGFSASDVENEDYTSGIDTVAKELVPSVEDITYLLYLNPTTSDNYLGGQLIHKDASHVQLINQSKASLSVNINPFNVIKYEGYISLHPDNDTWVDTQTRPDLVVEDLSGDLAAWNLIANESFSRTVSNWTDNWFGVQDQSPGQQTGISTRTVTTRRVVAERVTINLGNRVVDVSIVPFMRRVYIQTITTGMKSDTVVYPFFDNISVSDNYYPHSKIVLDANIGRCINNLRIAGNRSSSIQIEVRRWSDPSSTMLLPLVYANENVIYFDQKVAGESTPNFAPFNANDAYVRIGYNAGLPRQSLTALTSELDFYIPEDVVDLENESDLAGNFIDIDGRTVLVANVVSFNCLSGSTIYRNSSVPTKVNLTNDVNINVSGAENLSSSNLVGKKIIISDVFTPEPLSFHTATITSYDAANTTIEMTPSLPAAFTRVNRTYYYSIRDNFGTDSHFKTDINGCICGNLIIPGGQFRTGEKSFRLIDNSLNDIGSSSTWGDAKFFSQGTLEIVEPNLVSVIQPRLVTETTTETRPIYYDPLAQTFAVDPQVYPRGLFLSKIRLCFRTKDDIRPVRLELRPTVNGYPSSSEIYPYSTVELPASAIQITNEPSLTDPKKYTDFIFPSPVYLLPGEHSIVLISDSNKYEVYAAEMGGTDLNTGTLISDQPYGGSLFKSQNARTWTAEQNIDMMFSVYRYDFTLNSTTLQFIINWPIALTTQPGTGEILSEMPVEGGPVFPPISAFTNHLYDIVCLGLTDLQPPGTSITYEFDSYDENSNPVGYKNITPKVNYELNDGGGRRLISSSIQEQSFKLRLTLNSDYSDVSPIVKADSLSIHAIRNKINDLGLSVNDIKIENAGQNYNVDVSVVVTGGGGSGANVIAVRSSSNTIQSFIVDQPGSGYTSNPTITLNGGGPDATGAVITYNGETSKTGGNSDVRYLTKVVTLADGFESGDLRVYLTAYKPAGSDINVYYKVLSDSDSQTLNDKNWQLMTPLGTGNIFSSNRNEYREIVYAPGTDGVADNFVYYESYTSFKSFQIKVVMSTVDTTNPPRISDVRVIALPGETV